MFGIIEDSFCGGSSFSGSDCQLTYLGYTFLAAKGKVSQALDMMRALFHIIWGSE